MDYQDILDKIVEIIIADNRPPSNVHGNAKLTDDLHYDNLGIISLVSKVETAFADCEIPTSKISSLSIVGDLVKIVDSIINPES